MTTAIVTLITNSGETYVERVDFPKGEPENPLKENEFDERFTELAVYGGKTSVEARELIECVKNMNGSMERLFDCL